MADNEKQVTRSNTEARKAWNRNASFWDKQMGDGNDFFELLIWPPTERFLQISAGDHVLDVACGNGVSSRQLAQIGAKVTAIDFSVVFSILHPCFNNPSVVQIGEL